MPVLAYLHQLFNVDQCQADIHVLRWKDRPLQCPRCQSHDVDPWGTYHYRPGCKRYWCNGCRRTFNDLTQTLLHQSKRPLSYWLLAIFLLCLSCSSRRIARELGVHSRTSYRWCWWLRNAAVSYETDRFPRPRRMSSARRMPASSVLPSPTASAMSRRWRGCFSA